ncbi:helix-turn-helix transcriptional regulator [Gilliamella sp. B2776]|uniref:helix-turn-helix domain-containing protein n=1 Tax=unclassified Gilliamella TaxID=2685620 RepID=UPI0022699CA1|nr:MULTISPECIES: AraC family transcriptional regulator [unclassified Gilliamella]MCX8649006.1 helix-turn-helix transcriptional regulator [Gilliamella sp. B2779]MCX8653118.1 helix-turn-helix transcriptional regulator [Gilliamella sp. B2737]MCX8655378.1 helix-turn-helix transcriptional regulator [Gilliamella sp. B2894]MCX8664143.1 helix-turn-helix transcriptional regulator [Gilliamella sp. B2887]MCX8690818.1 helix-turn-helix transcriptional regulator [Gilliamella sp. B2776]
MSNNDSLVKVYNQNFSTLHFLYNITTDWHRHPCIQLTISLHNVFLELETSDTKQNVFGFIIQANIRHKLNASNICCINLLIEPEEPLYHLLYHFTEANPVYFLSSSEALKLAYYLIKSITLNQNFDIGHICKLLCEDSPNCECDTDNRINKAVSIISSLPVKQISSREVADQIFLSESRFLHLFRAKLGVNFRGYLLWKKLQGVMNTIDSPTTLTTLASNMGFSDSAHLSRTCLSSFGLRPSDLKRALIIDNKYEMCGKHYCLYSVFQALHT